MILFLLSSIAYASCSNPPTGKCCSNGDLVPGVAASSGACMSPLELKARSTLGERFTGAEPSNIEPKPGDCILLTDALGLAAAGQVSAAVRINGRSGCMTLLQSPSELASGGDVGTLILVDADGDRNLDLLVGEIALTRRASTLSMDLSLLPNLSSGRGSWSAWTRSSSSLSCVTSDASGLDLSTSASRSSTGLSISDLAWSSSAASWPSTSSQRMTRSAGSCR